MNRFLGCACLLIAVLVTAAARAEAPPAPTKWQWVYAPVNFQVDARVDELLALGRRAKTAGYNGILVADSKFGRLEGRPANYYANLARFKKAADELGLDVIPAVCPVGYSNDILQNNPNLAEGIAVRSDALCHLQQIAIRLGRKLRWDPAREAFVGDDEANRLLDRPMRAPWTL